MTSRDYFLIESTMYHRWYIQ